MVRKAIFDREFQRALEDRLDQADRLVYSETYSDSIQHQPVASLNAASSVQSVETPGHFGAEQTASHLVPTTAGEIAVDGNVLLCLCPDCQSPMTIRL